MAVDIYTMKRTNIYLLARQIRELKRLSAKTGATSAELVRRAVDVYLEGQKSQKAEVGNGSEKKE